MDYSPKQLREWVAALRRDGRSVPLDLIDPVVLAHADKIEECERYRKALALVMAYPEIRKHIGSQLSGIADAALKETK